ncbi:DNA methyltransferase [Halorientalis regularis]|uniref:Type II methyltransferase n=1 Tax=Halorientalis regularis TaxID=660518 RepID=A0A1G7TCB8_9EURY|nr:DNA methyltransferase [Halorientalis regularis]SDG32684.1 DNA methylase [Halorientalis regularis]
MALNPENAVREPPVYRRNSGAAYHGDSRILLQDIPEDSVDAVVTSPPFGLADPLEYGNPTADDYLDWFYPFAVELTRVVKPTGNILIEVGGGWKPEKAVRTSYQHTLPAVFCGSESFSVSPLSAHQSDGTEGGYSPPETTDTVSPPQRARHVGRLTWYNPGTDPNDSQEYAKNRKTRVRCMANPIHWFTPLGGDDEAHPPLKAPIQGSFNIDVDDTAWGLSNQSADTVPDTVHPSDFEIPGNFVAQPSDLQTHPSNRDLPPLPQLATLRSPSISKTAFTDAKQTVDQFVRAKLGLRDARPDPDRLPEPAALGIEPSELRKHLSKFCDPSPLAGGALLSYYRFIEIMLDREPAALSISNTASNTKYLQMCREAGRDWHPARFPRKLVEYLVPRVSNPGDVILDPFAGSNVVGAVAAEHNREWIAIDTNRDYLETSEFRFQSRETVTSTDDQQETLSAFSGD